MENQQLVPRRSEYTVYVTWTQNRVCCLLNVWTQRRFSRWQCSGSHPRHNLAFKYGKCFIYIAPFYLNDNQSALHCWLIHPFTHTMQFGHLKFFCVNINWNQVYNSSTDWCTEFLYTHSNQCLVSLSLITLTSRDKQIRQDRFIPNRKRSFYISYNLGENDCF